jgi:hypothetical protein
MIILRLSGGLGNQMFQYAFGRATAIRLGVQMVLDLSNPTLIIHNGFELNRVFGIQAKVATEFDMLEVLGWQRPEIIRKVLKKIGLASFQTKSWIEEPHFHFSPEMLHVPDETYLCGYWQSEKYFEDSVERVRDEFRFREPLSEVNKKLMQEIADGNGSAISLHVRRGDFVHNQAVSQVHGKCSMEYYRSAIKYLAERIQNPCFYVFSDDMDWVRNHLELPFSHKFIAHNRGEASYEDMRLMSLCQHHIIANSSFSWWSAWLNHDPDKVVVAPENWFADERHTHDLFPSGWIVL